MAEILRQGNAYHLRNTRISYILTVMPGGILAHLYFGKRLEAAAEKPLLTHMGAPTDGSFTVQGCALNWLSQEYPSFGLGDMREGAVTVWGPDGNGMVDLRFQSAEIIEGKPANPGLPATFGDPCATLLIHLCDALTGLEATLRYTIFDDCDAVARSVCLRNGGNAELEITKALSLCLDLPDSKWDLITLNGAWARERGVYRRPLMPGEQGTATRCGASSLQTSPFIALARPNADEHSGETIGAALIYSGNFEANVTVGQFDGSRMLMGINSRDFSWRLAAGESFDTPEAVLVYGKTGLNGMSQTFHHLWKNHLLPRRWVNRHRPVLLNSWEAAYFDFDEDKLVEIARAAAEAGAELFVVDDGWFGHRDDDTTSLGDWDYDPRKLPKGLRHLAERVRETGVQFGIWMEPEMVSPDSDLYRAHPEWSIHVPGREPITGRNQLILDMGRADVQQFVYDAVAKTIRESGAVYIKWDMNRNFSNIGTAALPRDRQKELPHRYIVGLYSVMERLTRDFPDVLFEGCASGGGRFDPGMLYYVPQFWCSDNTDALSRCSIQYGTTYFLPPSAMGSHVSAVPNHQTGRNTPMETRFNVALGGCFGYELDPRKLTDEDRAAMRQQIDQAKKTMDLRLRGSFHRLLSPYEGNETAWMYVSRDQSEALFTLVRHHAQANILPMLVRLCGLDPNKRYEIMETGEICGGDQLMEAGLCCPLRQQDASSLLYTLKAVD